MIKNEFLILDEDYNVHLKESELALTGNVLKVISTGICGSDLHIFDKEIEVPRPIILGHEVIGVIEKLDNPEDIITHDKLSVGDKVILAPGFKCGQCVKCATGESCIDRNFYGLNLPYKKGEGFYGGFSQYINLKKDTKLYKLPENLSIEEGLLVEIIAACVRAVKIGFDEKFSAKKKVFIVGAGVIGITTALIARLYGAEVVICDIIEHRLKKAASIFNLNVLNTKDLDDNEFTQKVKNAFGGSNPEIIIECAGTIKAIEQSLILLPKRGTLVVFGNYADVGNVKLSPSFICQNDIVIKGTSETYPVDMTDAISLLEMHPEIKFKELVTHNYSLSDYQKALEDAKNRNGIKVTFKLN